MLRCGHSAVPRAARRAAADPDVDAAAAGGGRTRPVVCLDVFLRDSLPDGWAGEPFADGGLRAGRGGYRNDPGGVSRAACSMVAGMGDLPGANFFWPVRLS